MPLVLFNEVLDHVLRIDRYDKLTLVGTFLVNNYLIYGLYPKNFPLPEERSL